MTTRQQLIEESEKACRMDDGYLEFQAREIIAAYVEKTGSRANAYVEISDLIKKELLS